MVAIKTKIVTLPEDKEANMVATLKRGATKEYIDQLLSNIAKEIRPKGINARKYCGKIELKEDSLTIQKRLRDEW